MVFYKFLNFSATKMQQLCNKNRGIKWQQYKKEKRKMEKQHIPLQ